MMYQFTRRFAPKRCLRFILLMVHLQSLVRILNMYDVRMDMHKSTSPLGFDSRALIISNGPSSGNFSNLHIHQIYSIQRSMNQHTL